MNKLKFQQKMYNKNLTQKINNNSKNKFRMKIIIVHLDFETLIILVYLSKKTLLSQKIAVN